MAGGNVGVSVALTGKVHVCCVHDRVKREVTTEAQVAELGREVGIEYDPRQHHIHLCSCCDNLFVDPSDEPRFCFACLRVPKHELGGPLPEPRGVIS